MANTEQDRPKQPRDNPFWSYRDPITGRWLTVMTSDQWQQGKAEQAFQPKARGYGAAMTQERA